MRNETRGFTLGGLAAEADLSGALWLPDARALLVADLHLGKAEALARRGGGLAPPFDSPATLARLADAIARFDPATVVSLGDAFHDDAAAAALDEDDRAALCALARDRRWIWVAGNHDPAPPAGCPGEALGEWRIDGLTLRHHPRIGETAAEAAGHLHPYARVRGARGSTGGRSFVTDGRRVVLPAFGAYAGGLDLRDPVFDALFPDGFDAIVMGRRQLFRIAGDAARGARRRATG